MKSGCFSLPVSSVEPPGTVVPVSVAEVDVLSVVFVLSPEEVVSPLVADVLSVVCFVPLVVTSGSFLSPQAASSIASTSIDAARKMDKIFFIKNFPFILYGLIVSSFCRMCLS